MHVKLSDLLELLGIVLLGVAAAAFDWRLFVALVGALLIVASYLLGLADDADGPDLQ